MDGFLEGYKYFEKKSGYDLGTLSGNKYIEAINNEVDKLVNDLNSFEGFNTNSAQLKGDIAEYWHAGTFNINASLNDSTNRAFVNRSHDFASVDVSSNFGKEYGLKYYSDSETSSKAQSLSYFQTYKEYLAHGGSDSFETFLEKHGRNFAEPFDPIYENQWRLISADQYDDAISWLEKKIAEESVKRPEQVKRLQDTLKMLTNKIEDDNGVESIALTKEEALELSKIAKEGNISASKLGLATKDLISLEYMFKNAFKAGLSAAIISMVIKTGPVIIQTIEYLIKNNELDTEKLKQVGFSAITGTSEGFIRGSVAAGLVTACNSGMLGQALQNVNPSILGAVVVVSINTIKNSINVAAKKMSKTELANELIKDLIISSCSLIGGTVSQMIIEIPVIGFMIGSFAGSIIGSLLYSNGYKHAISFCIDTGFTMFGLVTQDYKLPPEIIKEIGIEIFDYEKFEPERFEPERFEPERFEPERFEPDNLNITFLRRGVIGINVIGYTSFCQY